MSDNRATTAGPSAETNGELRNRVQQIRLDNQLGRGSAGRTGSSWLPWILCGLLALSWAGVGVRGYRNGAFRAPSEGAAAEGTASEGSRSTTSSPDAAPATVVAGTIQLDVRGYIVPASQVAVSPIDVAGRLIELNVVEGKYYKQGDVLAKIDPTSFEATVREAEANLKTAEKKLASAEQKLFEIEAVRETELAQVDAQIAETQAQKDLAERKYQRLTMSQPSKDELDQVNTDRRTTEQKLKKFTEDREYLVLSRPVRIAGAKADVEAAKSELVASKARVRQAMWRLENCVITSPIDGTVLSKKAEKYNLVNPLAFAATSGSVCDMADLSQLEVDLEIPVREISKLKVGQACRVRCDAYPKRMYEGRLDRIMPIANRAKSIVNVRVKVTLPAEEAKDPYLKPEMGADVAFLADAEKK